MSLDVTFSGPTTPWNNFLPIIGTEVPEPERRHKEKMEIITEK